MNRNKQGREKPRVLLIGALPPPHMGPTLATEVVLNSNLKETFDIIHLDTSDPRDVDTLGSMDLMNVWLAIKSYVAFVALVMRHRPRLVYMLVNQTTIGYLRDSVYILIAALFGLKVLCHLRGGNFRNWYESSPAPMRLYVRRIHSLVDGQIVLGERLRHLFDGLVLPERVFVVPNGKDIAAISRAESSAKSLCRVLFAANMKESKGVLDVLHAARVVHENDVDAEFHFLGGWSDQDTRGKIEAYLSLNKHLPIVWHGKLTGAAKNKIFARSDVFVFPTYYPAEGHPWVIVEAMAASLPIIATNHAAIPESVVHRDNGLLIEKRNPAMLAEAIMTLCQDHGLRRRMGARSRQLYEERFTESHMIAGIAAAFRIVLGIAERDTWNQNVPTREQRFPTEHTRQR